MLFLTARQARSQDPEVRKRAATKLGAGGRGRADGPVARHVSLLLELSRDPDGAVRAAAFDALARVADGRVADEMAAGLKDVEKLGEPAATAVRDAAARAYQAIGEAAVPVLAKLAKEKSQKAREAAMMALGAMGSTEADPVLVAALQDNRSSVRQLAIRALARTAATGSIRSLTAALEHRDPATRRSAIEALTGVHGGEAAGALARLTRDGDSGVREAAVRALAKNRSPEAIDALLAVFEGPDRALRQLAGAALKDLDWTPATPAQRALRAILRGDYTAAAAEGEAAVEPLAACLTDKSPGIRSAVTAALGLTAHGSAVRPLLSSLQESDPAVRQAAGEALVRIGAPAAAPLAAAVHETVRAAAPDIVARIGGPAAPPLLDLLEQGEPFMAEGAEFRRVADEQEAEQAERAAHLLGRLLGHAARDIDRQVLGRTTRLRDVVRVREIMPASRRDSVTTVVDTIVDCRDLRVRATAELERRKPS